MSTSIRQQLQEAVTLAKQGKKGEAQSLVSDVLQRSPDSADAWILMAQLVDDPTRQLECWKKASALRPEDIRIQANVARLQPDEPEFSPYLTDTSSAVSNAKSPSLTPTEKPKVLVRYRSPAILLPTIILAFVVLAGYMWFYQPSNPCSAYQMFKTVEPLEQSLLKYQDALDLAASTPRFGLAEPVSAMQQIRTDTEALVVAECAQDAKTALLEYMKWGNEGMIAFMAVDEAGASASLELARFYRQRYEDELYEMWIASITVIRPQFNTQGR